eukprot:scaffold319248_cov44-Prasinocladus_malaysianus.AAC.2
MRALVKSGRLRLLNKLFARALGEGVAPLGDEVYQQIEESCKAEFVEVIQDNQIDLLLNEYGLSDGEALRLLGRPMDPKKLMSAERMKVKRAEVDALQQLLKEAQANQTDLEESLIAKRREASELAAKFAPVAQQLEAVEDASQQWSAALQEGKNT